MKIKDYNHIEWGKIFTDDSSSPTCLRWKDNRYRGKNLNICFIKAGDVAGHIHTAKKSGQRYAKLIFQGEQWLIHRILWIIRNGNIDNDLVIDHIDGDTLNNKQDNLRLVTQSQNTKNQKMRNDNSSGKNGVHFQEIEGRVYAIAQWYGENGKQKGKYFRCDLLGKDLAFKLASEYRDNMIKVLESSGIIYSSRHGLQVDEPTQNHQTVVASLHNSNPKEKESQ